MLVLFPRLLDAHRLMASNQPTIEPFFEESKISSSVSADESAQFLEEHGFFYQADAEIGRLVQELDDKGFANGPEDLKSFWPALDKDPVSRQPSLSCTTTH